MLLEGLACFYLYCFMGWVWETAYVSIKDRHWSNRGFLKGPFIPIYGCGAFIILLATFPVQNNTVLVYGVGMLAASLLEYGTGDLMERLFQVRYWDYSHHPLNLNGHISLFYALGWGFFSVLLVKGVHQPVAEWIQNLPGWLTQSAVIFITIWFVSDLVQAINNALNLKGKLLQLSELGLKLARIQKRLDVLTAVFDDERSQIKTKTEQGKVFLEDWLALMLERVNAYKAQGIQFIKSDSSILDPDALRAELDDLIFHLKRQKELLEGIKNSVLKGTKNLLNRNPYAVSKRFSESLKELKNKK